MKRFFTQALLILAVSTAAGLIANALSRHPLPLFSPYSSGERSGESAVFSGDDRFISEIDTGMLLSLLESEQAVLLDARDPAEFEKSHIPSALNLPVSEFEGYFRYHNDRLRQGLFLVTYAGRGSAVKAYELARKLHGMGLLDVFVYPHGLEAWQNRTGQGAESN